MVKRNVEPKKGTKAYKKPKGSAAAYITRNKAIKKLQVPLKDFRKLCILKGIYPRDPRKKVKGKDKTYYLTKDIVWLSHEPVLDTLRAIKAHKKKLSKAIARKDKRKAMDIEERMPEIRLDHLVKERYPSFGDALEDLHDCLTLVFAFATLPVMSKVKQQTVDLCESLCREWKWYVCATKSLQQTFLSVRAIYYTAIVDGHTITWSEPYRFSSSGRTKDVDFRVMATFVDFYTTSLRFILFRLFQAKGWNYPLPGVSNDAIEKDSLRGLPHCTYFVQSDANAQGESTGKTKKDSATQQKLNDYLKTVADTSKDSEDASNEAGDSGDEKENQKKEKFLFDGLVFFLSPEVPAYSVDFLIYGCGGRIAEDSKSSVVTHYVTDRPSHPSVQIPANVERIQPQWLYDSLNTHVLLPTHEYSPDVTLPPHLSPYVDSTTGHVPQRAKELLALSVGEVFTQQSEDEGESEASSDEEEEQAEEDDKIQEDEDSDEESSEFALKKKQKRVKAVQSEELALSMAAMSKKDRWLYNRMQHGIREKEKEVKTLQRKAKTSRKMQK